MNKLQLQKSQHAALYYTLKAAAELMDTAGKILTAIDPALAEPQSDWTRDINDARKILSDLKADAEYLHKGQ